MSNMRTSLREELAEAGDAIREHQARRGGLMPPELTEFRADLDRHLRLAANRRDRMLGLAAIYAYQNRCCDAIDRAWEDYS